MFDIRWVPNLIVKDVEYRENDVPAIPDEALVVVAADPSWKRQRRKAKTQLMERGRH